MIDPNGASWVFTTFDGKDFEEMRPRERYLIQAKRLPEVRGPCLEGRRSLMGAAYTMGFAWKTKPG